ncbi:L-rhamnose mutarotase [Streptomyces sp. NPDC005131]
MAGHGPGRAHRRRAHARHRRRHQGRGPPAVVLTRRRRPRRADGLLRPARGSRHGRPRATDVNTRWQADMAGFFEALDGAKPDEAMKPLTEVFHLERPQ